MSGATEPSNKLNYYIPSDIIRLDDIKYKNKRYITSVSISIMNHMSFQEHNNFDEADAFLRKYNNVMMYLIKDDRYLYADFDCGEICYDLAENLIRTYVNTLNQLIGSEDNPITSKDFQYHTKIIRQDGESVGITSLHIVSTKYVMNYEQQNLLHKAYNETIKEQFDTNEEYGEYMYADEKMYSSGRAFYGVGSGKFNGKIFEYDEYLNQEFNDYPYKTIWIDQPTNYIQLTYTEPLTEATDDETEINTENQVEHDDPIQYIIDHKELYLYNAHNWFDLLRYCKWSKKYSRDVFCDISRVGKNSYVNNQRMWDDESIIYVIKDIQKLFNRITSKKLKPTIFTEHFFKYINATQDERKEYLSMRPTKNGNYNTDRVKFNGNSGMLCMNGKWRYYYGDVEYERKQANKPEYIQVEPTTENIEPLLSKPLLKIRAKWGTGKTHFVFKPIFERCVDDDVSLTSISQSNALNTQITSLKHKNPRNGEEVRMATHQDKIFDSKWSICSLESIHKLKDKAPQVLVLDEFVSLMTHFTSTTMNTTEKDNTTTQDKFKILFNMIKMAEQVIILDADLTHTSFDYLFESLPKAPIYELTTKKFDDIQFNLFFDERPMYEMIFDDIITKKFNVCIASNMRSLSNNLRTKYVAQNIKTLTINKDGVYLNNDLFNKDESKSIQAKLDDFIQEHKIQLFIYSPTITTGVSVNTKDYFNTQYNFFNRHKTTNARTALQMTQRVRHITSKTHNILLSKPRRPYEITIEDIRKQRNEDLDILKSFNISRSDYNEHFITTFLTAKTEDANSTQSFTYALYELLREHRLNINFVMEVESKKDESVSISSYELHEFSKLKYPSKEQLKNIIIKLNTKDPLEYDESIMYSFLRIFLNGTYETTYDVKRPTRLKHDKKITEIIERHDATYIFYGLYSYDELDVFMNRNDYEQSLMMYYQTKIAVNYQTICKYQNYDKDNIIFTNDNPNVLDETNKKNIRIYLHKFITNFEKDGVIKNIKIDEQTLTYINKIKHRSNSGKLKQIKTTDIDVCIDIINRMLHTHYGFYYERQRYKEPTYKRITDRSIIFKSLPVKHLPSDIIYTQNHEDKYGKNTRTSIYGFKLMNSYGSKDPSRLKKYYNNPASKYPLPPHAHIKEYTINPNTKTKNLMEQPTALWFPPANELKTYKLVMCGSKILVRPTDKQDKSEYMCYADAELIKNVNADYIKETRDKINSTDDIVMKQRMIRNIEAIPRDVIALRNVNKYPAIIITSIDKDMKIHTRYFISHPPRFTLQRTDLTNYPYELTYADKDTPKFPTKKLTYDEREMYYPYQIKTIL